MYEINPANITEGPKGQLAHQEAVKHLDRLAPKLHAVGDSAWCFVGNGLSNQTFIRGPGGLIAIDTGESNEEMAAALKALRKVTQDPIVACIYSHFHYVNGTQAILDEGQLGHLDIYAHEGIPANLERFGGEVAPRSGRGLVQQFGTMLPETGPDGLLHCGLGLFYRNKSHAPFTAGYIPANLTFSDRLKVIIAGLEVHMSHAPSDATDSITIWFPDLKICVNNLVWPALFNVFAIRGEEYRDPRILLQGIDEIAAFQPDHLIGTHGPPLSEEDGGSSLVDQVHRYRDTIQFMWDQTVRLANKGRTINEIASEVALPAALQENYLTQEFYGLVEHHVRQIHSGLFGWFDENPAHLFALPDQERHQRLIKGFGGRDSVVAEIDQAIEVGDLPWAIELATWLTSQSSTEPADRERLAHLLRSAAQHATAANIRNWCLTRALELEGAIDLTRHRTHRFGHAQVMAAPPTRFVGTLRVLLDPVVAEETSCELAWHFAGGEKTGLRLRNAVAVTTNGMYADAIIGLSHETWADVLSNRQNFWAAVSEGTISIAGKETMVEDFFAAFEVPSLHR